MLRVAMISLHTNPLAQPGTGNAGGMNVYVLQLAKALAQLGVEVELFTRAESPSGQLPMGAEITPSQVAPKVRLWEIPTQTIGLLPKEQLAPEVESFTQGVAQIIARLESETGPTNSAKQTTESPSKVQLIHSHYWLSGMAGLALAAQLDIPLVHAMHTTGWAKNAALPPGDIPEPLARLNGEALIVENANALIAATEFEAKELVAHYGAAPENVFVIPPGVDRSVFHPGSQAAARQQLDFAQLLIPTDAKVILFAGRIQRLKNPSVLVRALPELPADAYLVILGGVSGLSMGETELIALATDLGVANRVRILAPVPATTLANWYRAADVVAVPSYNESYGLVAAEAIASGCPVVAAKVGGLMTVVADGKTGLLVDSHEPPDWAAALNSILADDAVRAELAANCTLDTALYDWQRTATETLALYESLVSLVDPAS